MNDKPAITCHDLGKRYRVGTAARRAESFAQTAREAVLSPFSYLRTKLTPPSEQEVLWALRHVSFEVARGEVVGIIGANGSGKSTLLKLLSRITEPTEGHAVVRGRVNSLLEVGTGFHPELTGRENVYMAAAIQGMKRNDVDAVFDAIIAFSGVERFLDTPLKRYSSGMRVRLGFAVAAHLNPDVLIVDEVLAVGDLAFQKRCADRMEKAANSGSTVLVVSHRMESILALCSRAILLESGQKTAEGVPGDVVEVYTSRLLGQASVVNLRDRIDRRGDGRFRYADAWLTSEKGERVSQVLAGESLNIHLAVEGNAARAEGIVCMCTIYTRSGECVSTLSSHRIGMDVVLEGRCVLKWTIPKLPLTPGEYRCNVFMSRNPSGTPQMELIDSVTDAFTFSVMDGDFFGSGVFSAIGRDKVFIDHSLRICSVAGSDTFR